MKIYYKRHLPHYQPPGYTFFVTFRLAGSLPENIIKQLTSEKEKEIKLIAGIKNKKEKIKKYNDQQINYFEKFDSYLHAYNESPHWLRIENVAKIVYDSIRLRDDKEYSLIAFTIMPNHVHMVFTPITENGSRDLSRPVKSADMNVGQQNELNKPIVTEILRKLKGSTSRECNKILNRSGAFWQHESYDHIVRDEEDLNRIIEYVLSNPIKARFVENWGDWKWNYCKLL